MKILVACERSGKVRDALRSLGHEAWSCDTQPCDADPEYHIRGDVLPHTRGCSWGMMIAFPPCTHLCVSGAGAI